MRGEAPRLRRKKNVRGPAAKYKNDVFQKIFQSFVDLVYFLEFIEDHLELHELYENTLKDLFGISNDESSPQPRHYKNRSTSLFVRFISASLFRSYGYAKRFDFRVPLANVLIFQAIDAMQSRLYENNELRLFINNVENTQLWSKLLSTRYMDKDTTSRHRIGNSVGVSHIERTREEEKRKKELEEKKALLTKED